MSCSTQVNAILANQQDKNIELLTTGKFSDFVLRCKGDHEGASREFKVHRAIMHGKSAYFDRLIDSNFKESIDQEATIEEHPSTLALVLWVIYTNSLPNLSSGVERPQIFSMLTQPDLSNIFICYIELLEATDRMLLSSAHELARQVFVDEFPNWPSNWNERTAEIEAMVIHTFAQDSLVSSNTKKLVAWTLIARATTKDLRKISKAPEQFLWHLLEESEHLRSNHPSRCYGCKDDIMPSCKILMVQQGDAEFVWIKCGCDFRGFCSEKCKAVNDPGSFYVYCSECLCSFPPRGEEVYCNVERSDGLLKHIEKSKKLRLCQSPEGPSLEPLEVSEPQDNWNWGWNSEQA